MGSLGGFRGAEPRPKRAQNLRKTRVFSILEPSWSILSILFRLMAFGAILGPSWDDFGAILGRFGRALERFGALRGVRGRSGQVFFTLLLACFRLALNLL